MRKIKKALDARINELYTTAACGNKDDYVDEILEIKDEFDSLSKNERRLLRSKLLDKLDILDIKPGSVIS